MNPTDSLLNYLEHLEKDFEKASVDLDVILNNPDFNNDVNTISMMKKRLHVLSSCFSQLYHKLHLTIQSKDSLLKDTYYLKEELLKEKAKFAATNTETSQLVTQLHALQLQLHSATIGDGSANLEPIKKKLQNELDALREEARSQAYLKEEVMMLKKENTLLNNRVAKLQDELYGARLAAKYMDKEISGRIQQIQLLGQNNKLFNVEKMWRQLEAEILFHRQKTVIKAHKGVNKYTNHPNKQTSRKPSIAGKTRHVTIQKKLNEGLGISVVGGSENGVPIIITEIHEGGVVDSNGGLMIGDAILSVNGIDIKNCLHQEAIQALTQKTDMLNLEVRFVDASECSDDDGSVLDVEIAGANLSRQEPINATTTSVMINGKASRAESVSTNDSGLEANGVGFSNGSASKLSPEK